MLCHHEEPCLFILRAFKEIEKIRQKKAPLERSIVATFARLFGATQSVPKLLPQVILVSIFVKNERQHSYTCMLPLFLIHIHVGVLNASLLINRCSKRLNSNGRGKDFFLY